MLGGLIAVDGTAASTSELLGTGASAGMPVVAAFSFARASGQLRRHQKKKGI
jgi:hypothetical protein